VITQSYLDGIQVADQAELLAAGHDLAVIAERIVGSYLRMVFIHGVFHADPHPANILVCDGHIGLVDFGIVGYLTPRVRRDLGDLLFALVQRSAEDVVHVMDRMGAIGPRHDRDALLRDIGRLVVRYYSASMASVAIGPFVAELFGIAFRHQIHLPADLALLARTVAVLEGVARALDPSLVLVEYLQPFVREMLRERLSPRRLALQTLNTLRDVEDLARALPRRLDALSRQLQRGDLTVGIDVRHLDASLRRLDAVANRLAFSVIVAAIVIGSALVMGAGEEAGKLVLPLVGITLPFAQIGFVVAAFMGTWLVFSILRSRGL
jgi:ubiquinone biosynthesis protein